MNKKRRYRFIWYRPEHRILMDFLEERAMIYSRELRWAGTGWWELIRQV